MNVFYLDSEPDRAAFFHCDKHVVKMILETAQLLPTAHRILDADTLSPEKDEHLYKETHSNHPSAVWVRASKFHYEWTFNLLKNLCKEYTFRYEKTHKTEGLLPFLKHPPVNIATSVFVEPPLCMPDECKIDTNSAVASYRNYYLKEKAPFAKWTKRNPPRWWTIPTSSLDK